MSVRVVVVDDQTLVRQGIVGLLGLSGEVEVVGQASDGAEGLEIIERLAPEVVLLDLRMPVLDGLGVLQRLAASENRTPVLVLTTFPDDDALIAAMRAGARGYLLKDVSLDHLVEAIVTLAAGGTLIQPSVTEARFGVVSRGSGAPPSKPAAMTVTRTSSPRVSSMTVPKMMFASG